MTKLDWDFFGAYIFALIVLGGLIAAGIAYGLPNGRRSRYAYDPATEWHWRAPVSLSSASK